MRDSFNVNGLAKKKFQNKQEVIKQLMLPVAKIDCDAHCEEVRLQFRIKVNLDGRLKIIVSLGVSGNGMKSYKCIGFGRRLQHRNYEFTLPH